ncbi:MAG: cupin domain-containing protein [Methylovulum sp.]|uniref:cupin domain-containing protein n=1 Tax=Methylovulum sp. TaxID=1916980 RepID=UPI00261D831E|nr:cupin domain-containing protein [Methylovulum sp.]MDD2723861.1 cupin domain-containing protein [Methylovulum sp.]MDD5125211.1 cupin domain-containing protein [Methylovulum sp.]
MRAQILKANEDDEYYFDEGCFILELSNTAADETISIARARVRPGVTTKLHRLRGVVERYVMLAGAGRVDVDGLPPQTVKTGDVVIIPPECPQQITNIGDDDLVFLAICTPRFTQEIYEAME